MRRRTAFVIVFALLVPTPFTVGQTDPSTAFEKEDFTVDASDGVTLAATVYRPLTPGPYAAILLTHGWPEWRGVDHVKVRAERFATNGYLVVAYDSRGFGGSEGETTLDGPREVEDAMGFIDWIAQQPDVLQEGDGDPILGMFGRSYAGGLAQLTTMADPRVDALIPEITWGDLYMALVPNDVIKLGWINLLYYSGQAETHGIPAASRDPNNTNPDPEGGASSKLSEWYATAMATNEASAELKEELHVVRTVDASRIIVPTMFIQGWNDTLFDGRHATKSFMTLRDQGTPAKLLLYSGGHGVPLAWTSQQSKEIEQRIDAWFDHYLRMNASAGWVADWPVEHWYPWESRFQGEASWPPVRVLPTFYYLSGTEGASAAGGGALQATPPEDGEVVRLAQLAAPTNFVEVPNFQQYDPNDEHASPGTSVVFATEPLPDATELLGAPVATLSLSREAPNGEIIVMTRIVDIDPSGKMTTVLKQVTPVRVEVPTGAAPAHLTNIELAPLTHVFAQGHRIGLGVATSDPAFSASREANTVGISTASSAPSYLFLPMVNAGIDPDPFGPFASIDLPSEAPPGTNVTFRVHSSDNLRVTNLTIDVFEGETLIRSETWARPPSTLESWIEATTGEFRVRATVEDVGGKNHTAEDTMMVLVRPPPAQPVSDEVRTPAPMLGLVILVLASAVLIRRRKA